MPVNVDMPTFAGGEVSPSVAARYDVAKYHTALARMRNCLGLPEGGAYMRPGFEFASRVRDSSQLARLIPFQFSVTQGYAIEITPGRLRIYYQGGLLLRPMLRVIDISNAANAVVNVIAHGYSVGEQVYFHGGDFAGAFAALNGGTYNVVAVGDANHFTIDADTSTFGAFGGDGGEGIDGNANGGVGGYPAATPDPPPFQDVEPPPVVIPIGTYYGIY